MKKLLTGLLAMFMGLTVTMAQTPATAKKEAKAAKAKTEQAAPKTKKDGTPDMRFKDNKAAATATGPKKKDGTPDMRFKDNNKSAGKKKS